MSQIVLQGQKKIELKLLYYKRPRCRPKKRMSKNDKITGPLQGALGEQRNDEIIKMLEIQRLRCE